MNRKFTFLVLILLFSLPVFSEDSSLFSPMGIAEIHIDLSDGMQIDDIKRDEVAVEATKLEATMTIVNANGSTYGTSDLYEGKIRIKGRGNTTWGRPKRPYSIDLVDDNGESVEASLLGMPKDEDWALLAFWNDRSLMRNPLAYYLGRRMDGLMYSPRFRYVEIYINGDYRGLYMLCESIKRAKKRVDIAKLSADSTNLSGGYILEVKGHDRVKDNELNTEFKTTLRGVNYVFKYPKPENATPEMVAWIKSYMDNFETAIYSKQFKDPELGYQKFINEDSFVDWFILHDLSKGVDNLFNCSVFFQKDRDDKLSMSAPWDFDISFGNHDGECGLEHDLWIKKTHYFYQLYKDERWENKLVNRFEELMPLFDSIPYITNLNYQQLEASGCLERDNAKFPNILTEFRNPDGVCMPTTIKGHVQYFQEWLASRKAWLNINYGYTEEARTGRLKNTQPVIRIMNPESYLTNGTSPVRVMPGFTYIWNGSYVTTNPVYNVNRTKTYTVKIKDTNSNVSLSSVGVGKVVSISTVLDQTITMYPNPVKENLYINFISGKELPMSILLYNLQGNIVKQTNYSIASGFNQLEMNLSDLVDGLYVIKYIIGSETIVNKIVVSK